MGGGKIHPHKAKNSEINRGISNFDAKIAEFCPKSANFS